MRKKRYSESNRNFLIIMAVFVVAGLFLVVNFSVDGITTAAVTQKQQTSSYQEEDITKFVDLYNKNIGELPKFFVSLFKKEKIDLYVDSELVFGFKTNEDGKIIETFKGGIGRPTLNIYITEDTLDELLSGKINFEKALMNGDMKYSGVGFFNKAKYGFVKIFSGFFISSEMAVEEVEEEIITEPAEIELEFVEGLDLTISQAFFRTHYFSRLTASGEIYETYVAADSDFVIEIINTGSIDINELVKLKLEWIAADPLPAFEFDVDLNLPAGESTEFILEDLSERTWVIRKPFHVTSLDIGIDSDNIVNEVNENNNILDFDSFLPNLNVLSRISREGGVRFDLYNGGQVDAENIEVEFQWVSHDNPVGEPFILIHDLTLPPRLLWYTEFGQTEEICPSCYLSSEHPELNDFISNKLTNTVRITVDPNNLIPETNEEDNSVEVDVN